MKIRILVILTVTVVWAILAEARTWRVERDGSGDWLSIQAAVEASASGDTILIGPGRYDQLHAAPYGQTAVAYWNAAKNLVFVGENLDSVIIGPNSYVLDSKGLFCESNVMTEIRNITFENLNIGAQLGGGGEIIECRFTSCDDGAGFFGAPGYSNVSVTNSEFVARPGDNDGYFFNVRDLDQVTVENCTIIEMRVYMQDVSMGLVRKCQFQNQINPIATNFNRSNVEFLDNEVIGGVITAQNSGRVVVTNNHFLPSSNGSNLAAEDVGLVVEINDNVFGGAGFTTIYVLYGASIIGSGNHILNGGSEYTVYLTANNPSNLSTIDLRNNFWGVKDSTSIANLILDVNDDPGLYSEVQFMPFADMPLPAEQVNFGSFKAMFR